MRFVPAHLFVQSNILRYSADAKSISDLKNITEQSCLRILNQSWLHEICNRKWNMTNMPLKYISKWNMTNMPLKLGLTIGKSGIGNAVNIVINKTSEEKNLISTLKGCFAFQTFNSPFKSAIFCDD